MIRSNCKQTCTLCLKKVDPYDSKFLGLLQTTVIDEAVNELQNDCGPVLRPKSCTSNTQFEHIVTFDTTYCSDRNTVHLKDLTFLFLRQLKLWNLRIGVVTASAGTLP